MKKGSRARRIKWYLIAGVTLAVVEYYYVFRAGLLNDRLRAVIMDRANARLTGRLEIGGFEGDLFDRFTISDLRLFEPDGTLALAIGNAEGVWTASGGPRPKLEFTADHVYVRAVKRDGLWNFRRLRKQRRPRTRPSNLPAMDVAVTARDAIVDLSWSPERMVHGRVPFARAELAIAGPRISFSITDLQAAVSDPALGINGFLGRGEAVSTKSGWQYNLHSGQMITASSAITILNASYDPGSAGLAANFPTFTIAPDTLALFWAKHPLVIPLTGRAAVSGKTSDLAVSAVIASSAGDLIAAGKVLDRGRQGKLSGEMTDFSLGDFVDKKYDLTGLSGHFDLTYYFDRAGEKRDRRIQLELDLAEFTYPGFNSLPVSAEIKLENDAYKGSLMSEAPGIRLAANFSGSVAGGRPLTLEAVARGVDPSRVKKGAPAGVVSGRVRLEGEGTGLENFRGRGELTVSNTRISGFELERGDFAARIGDGKIMFDRAEAVSRGAALRGEGWVKVTDKSYPFSFDVSGEMAHSEDVAALMGGRAEADRVAGTFTVKGDRSRWSAEGSAVGLGARVSALTAESVDVKVTLAGLGGQRLSGRISMLARNAEVPKAKYKDFSISSFDLAGEIVIAPSSTKTPKFTFDLHTPTMTEDFGLNTKGNFDGRGAGNWGLTLSEFALRIMGMTYTAEGPAKVASPGGGIELEPVTISRGQESLTASGKPTGRSLDFDLHVERFDLMPWARALLPGDSIEGVMTGDVKISGPGPASELAADLAADGFAYQGTRFRRMATVVAIKGGQAAFTLAADSEDAGDIKADGMLPVTFSMTPYRLKMRPDDPMEINIDAPDAPARFLETLLPWISKATGSLALTAGVRGTWRAPEWNGQAALTAVAFTVPAWGLAIKDLSGDAAIVRNKVTIPRLTVRSGEGEAELSGEFTLAKFSVADLALKLTARNFQAMNSPNVRAALDADLNITGDFNRPRARGDVRFLDLVYRPPLLLQYQGTAWEDEDRTILVRGEKPKKAGRSPLVDRTDLALDISIPKTGKLKSAELNVRFEGDLELKKPPGAFYLIIGKLESKEGWITFQGRPFRVERGLFNFPAIPAIDPDLDILASYRVPDYTTFIKIGGRFSAPTLEIYSEPPLDPADALAVVLFGKPAGELAEGQRNALASAGANILAGYAAAELAQSLQETLHIDTIILQPGAEAGTSGVGFETYLTDRLYLYFFHRFGEDAAEEFRLRYELLKNFSLEAGQDEKGQGGIDLFFHYLFGKPEEEEKEEGTEPGMEDGITP